jgi:hypothetical protein
LKISIDNKFLSLPDFLIIGGERCGTSSLYAYLKEHPDVFMPDLKEPLFFNNLASNRPPHPNWPPWTIERYATLFEAARPEQTLGEASALYLYSHDTVIPTLRSIYGEKARDVRIVMILRNPVDRAWSFHMLLRRSGDKMSFFEMVDKYCGGEKKTSYNFLTAGNYTEQVRDYLSAFDSVRIFMFEDLQQDSAAVLHNIFELIGVNDTGFVPWNINTAYNASGSPKSGLSRLVYNLLFHNIELKRVFKHFLPLQWRLWIKAKLGARIMEKVEMPSDVREFLTETYKESIESLRALLPDPAQKAVVEKWLM